MGLGISFSTLQDTRKTHNKLSIRVWENPAYAKIFLIFLLLFIIALLSFGLYEIFASKDKRITRIYFGIIIFAIGWIGLLKTATEVAEYNSNKAQSKQVG
jgi:hypothetical protein